MRERALDALAPPFKVIVFELLARLTEAGILVLIVETRRTAEQHAIDIANHRSWIARSLHQDGFAIDLCPYSTWAEAGPDKLNWNGNDPIWQHIGVIGERLGLIWGGRWAPQRDLGHFEMRRADAISLPHA